MQEYKHVATKNVNITSRMYMLNLREIPHEIFLTVSAKNITSAMCKKRFRQKPLLFGFHICNLARKLPGLTRSARVVILQSFAMSDLHKTIGFK